MGGVRGRESMKDNYNNSYIVYQYRGRAGGLAGRAGGLAGWADGLAGRADGLAGRADGLAGWAVL